jgi:outer membrane protein TolC
MAAAQREGNQTADSTAAALTALSDARRQLAEAQRAAAQSRHDLNALLDIAPDVELSLRAPDAVLPPGDATLDTALAALPKRRPDLIALQWGYRAQEEKYRAAILNQFPSLSVGFVRARDTSEIYTSGFQINLSLPLFNRNRGNVAIESATRQRLRDEYQIRLDQAQAEVARLRDDDALLARQLAQANSALPGLETAARQAQTAFAQHDLTIGAYTDAQMAALTRRVDIATLSESLAEARVGLQALLGSAIPDAENFTHAHEN